MLHIMIQANIVAQLVAKAVVALGAVLAHHGQGPAWSESTTTQGFRTKLEKKIPFIKETTE